MKPIGKNSLLARLRVVAMPVDPVPPNFKTDRQWAREWGVHRMTARKLIGEGVAARVMVRKTFRIRLPDGRSFPVPHYAEK